MGNWEDEKMRISKIKNIKHKILKMIKIGQMGKCENKSTRKWENREIINERKWENQEIRK